MTNRRNLMAVLLASVLAAAAPPLAAQEAGIQFGGLKTDISQPVQVTAETLSINQADGSASFAGKVVITQGDMRLEAAAVTVRYSADRTAIDSLEAEGGVTLSAGTDAATADRASYLPGTGDLTLAGNVLLTQGQAAISGQSLVLNLESGLGTMSGNVTTVFTPGNN